MRLRSNVTLRLEPGSVIEASADAGEYDTAEPNQWDKFQDFGHSHFHDSLIWGEVWRISRSSAVDAFPARRWCVNGGGRRQGHRAQALP